MKTTPAISTSLIAVLVSSLATAAERITFSKDVAPILQRACQTCHRPGQIAPMSLLTYNDVRPWARSIQRMVEERIMPPWHVDRSVGIQEFKNDRSLTQAQIDTLSADAQSLREKIKFDEGSLATKEAELRSMRDRAAELQALVDELSKSKRKLEAAKAELEKKSDEYAALASSPLGLARDRLVELIREAGKIPVERDALYNVIKVHDEVPV